MWVNQWFHTAEKLNLKPKTDESLAAPGKHLLLFRQHRLNASSADPLREEALPGNNSEHPVGLIQRSLFLGQGRYPDRNLGLDVHTQLSSSWLSSFSKLTLIYLLQPQLSPCRSFKSDIPVFFEMGILAKLLDVQKWAEQAPFGIICINTMLVVICQDLDAVQTTQKWDLLYCELFNPLGLGHQMF